jgi:hypothetical protein
MLPIEFEYAGLIIRFDVHALDLAEVSVSSLPGHLKHFPGRDAGVRHALKIKNAIHNHPRGGSLNQLIDAFIPVCPANTQVLEGNN